MLRDNWKLLAVLFALEGLRYAFDFWKFGKAASYHSLLAKAWGLVMAAAMVGVFAVPAWRWLVPVAIGFGIVTNCEGFAMSLILPRWQNDVKTLAVAWSLRGRMLSTE